MFLDPTDTSNKYYQCGVETAKRKAEKHQNYLIAKAERSEQIRQEGIQADILSRSFRGRNKNLTETNRQLGILFSK